MNPQTRFIHHDDGKMTEVITNNVEPLFEGLKDMRGRLPKKGGVANAKYIGSVDPVTIALWAKEWGVKPHSKEFTQLAAKRIKTDSDWDKYKFDWGVG